MTTVGSRSARFLGLIAIALSAAVLPTSAHAVGVDDDIGPTPIPTAAATSTPAPISYTPKALSGKCNFPSDKLIEKIVAEQLKVSLAGRGIARPAVRVKLSKAAAAASPITLNALDFSVALSPGGGPLDYQVVTDGSGIELRCFANRDISITVSAAINGAKTNSKTKKQIQIQGLLK